MDVNTPEKAWNVGVDIDDAVNYDSLIGTNSLFAQASAGAFAGIVEHTVMYPIDVIKTRVQVERGIHSRGILQMIKHITKTEGIRSLWRGLPTIIVGAGPAHALYFGTYEFSKHRLGGNAAGHHPIISSISGASATIMSEAFMNPFDVIKQRMQLSKSDQSIWRCTRNIYKSEGLTAFYLSYPTVLTMSVPLTMIQFTTYESASKILNPSQAYDPITHIISGGTAGAIAAALTTPLDVIRTMLQTRGRSSDREIRSVSSLWEAARLIWNREGQTGFLKGLRPRIVSAVPSTALCWLSYEAGKEVLKQL